MDWKRCSQVEAILHKKFGKRTLRVMEKFAKKVTVCYRKVMFRNILSFSCEFTWIVLKIIGLQR